MFSFSRESRSYNQRVEDDPEKQLFKEIQKDDKVECLSREIEALGQMRSKYAEELKEKVLEEDEKRAILEREETRARKQAQEEQYYVAELRAQQEEIDSLQSELRRATENSLKMEEERRNSRIALLRELEQLAREMEEAKELPKLIEIEKKRYDSIEEQLRALCKGKFQDATIETFDDFGEECNAMFDRVIAREKDSIERSLIAVNEVLSKSKADGGGAFILQDTRKRKAEEEEEEKDERAQEKKEIPSSTPNTAE